MAADRVPTLGIAPTCRSAAVGKVHDVDFFLRDTLEHSWDDYTAAERSRCSSLARMGGAPRYVELLTCLEMASAADALPDTPLHEPPGNMIRR